MNPGALGWRIQDIEGRKIKVTEKYSRPALRLQAGL